MLVKPDLEDVKISDCLHDHYGLKAVQVTFLPLGADADTAVYRVVTDDAIPYFVKLRRGAFNETTVLLPKLLYDQGVKQVIPPLSTHSQQLWASLGEFRLTVSPFVEGHNGFQVDLPHQHWVEFGRALKSIHTAVLPPTLTDGIPSETFSPQWRELVRDFQKQAAQHLFSEPVAAEMAAFMKSRHDEINWLVHRAEQFASILQTQPLELIVCHADIHVGNLLIDTHHNLYVVDWDTLTLAPKERDLMFVGGGLGGGGHTAEEEETLFYQGYGPTEIDPLLLSYYRYERIVQDIAEYCEQILLTDEGGEDRAQGLHYFMGQFLPGEVVEMAYRSEKYLPQALKSEQPPTGI